MNQFNVIKDIVIILSVSIPIIYLFKKLNIPSIIGFLIAGMIIGPYGFQLITEIEQIQVMAEIGVILLLFVIGLEVSFVQIMIMKRFLITVAVLQVVLTIIVTAGIFYLAGLTPSSSLFFGMLISLSSTAIVLKLLHDRMELETPHGRIILGITIVQDLAIVPMFIFVPVLGAGDAVSFADIILKIIFSFGAVAAILLAAKFLMPFILYQLAKLRVREAFTVGVLLLVMGTAYLTSSIGLSFALGAFIAGLTLSESDFSHQIVAEVIPLRDAFNTIFFVSIGLLLNIQFVVLYPLQLLGLSIGIVVVKAVIIILIISMMKYPSRIAVMAGIGLAQIGEFSFVLAQQGVQFNLMDEMIFNSFIASSILTMMIAPLLFRFSPYFAKKSGNLENLFVSKPDEKLKLKGHVIIVGYGLNGKNVARVLKETGIQYIIVELNPDTVKKEKDAGEKIIYGDSSKEDILETVNVKDANVIVFAISDPFTSRIGLSNAKKLNPKIYAIVRTRYINEIDDLMKLGADAVIPEEFETSLQIFGKVLERYHIPLNIIMKQTQILRGESYSLMRNEADERKFIHLDEILAQGLTETYFVDADNPHINKNLIELDLRAKTDATIIAIVRDKETISSPSGKERIKEKDTLVITGNHQAVDDAINYLDEVSEN
jgi:monovalent cation:H+ antiporter-2, CPA2 family